MVTCRVEIDGKKYYHCFTAGQYAQATITSEHLRQIAERYDASVHMAPVWIGHPSEDPSQVGVWEPEALAWVDSVIAVEDKLYISFAYVGPEFRQLIESHKFKYVSVEIVTYNDPDAGDYLYLFAVGLTNRPAVKGLPPLTSVAFTGRAFRKDHQSRVAFSESFQKNNNNMNKHLLDIAKAANVATDNMTEEAIVAAVTAKFAASPVQEKPTTESDSELQDLKAKLEAVEAERVAELVDTAVKSQKILPAQVDKFTSLAKADFKLCKEILSQLPAKEDLTKHSVTHGGKVNFADPRFKDPAGKQITYRDYLKMDADGRAAFTDEEVAALREQSEFKRK